MFSNGRMRIIILFLVLLSPIIAPVNHHIGLPNAWADNGNNSPTPFPPLFGTSFGGPNGQGDQAIQKNPVLKYPSQGHVYVSDPSQCQSFAYSSDPPTSGAMTHDWMSRPDLPIEKVPGCTMVHVLSKGNVILFIDPKRLSKETLQSIEILKGPEKSPDAFMAQERIGYSVLVIRTSKYKDPILLAAWRRLLPLGQWDQIIINAFISGHLGNPHRGE